MNGDTDEDAITIENLQAQIDMSMSFAQSLVSSWVKPSNKATNSRRKELESELLENARRRPRLGVGAAQAEVLASSRDTARLKGQLVGKKRAREQAGAEDPTVIDFEDGDESRARAIKKKIKVDPFSKLQKKKKALMSMDSKHFGQSSLKEGEGAEKFMDQDPVPETPAISSSLNKKKGKNGQHESLPIAVEDEKSPLESGGVSNPPPVQPISKLSTVPTIPRQNPNSSHDGSSFTSSTSLGLGSPKFETISTTSSTISKDGEIKLSTTILKGATFASSTNLEAELSKRPLLNLEEISGDSDSGKAAIDTPLTSPKKKKRKRKKKKKLDNIEPLEPAQSNPVKILIH